MVPRVLRCIAEAQEMEGNQARVIFCIVTVPDLLASLGGSGTVQVSLPYLQLHTTSRLIVLAILAIIACCTCAYTHTHTECQGHTFSVWGSYSSAGPRLERWGAMLPLSTPLK